MTTLPPEPQPENPYNQPQAEPPTQPFNPNQPHPGAPQYPAAPHPAAPQYQYPPAPEYPGPAAPTYGQPPQYGQQPQYQQPGYQQQPYDAAPQYPPAGYPPQPGQPGQYLPGAVPPKKSRKTLWVIIVLVVLLCCCGGGIGGGYVLYNRVSDQTSAISDAAKSFFTAVVNHNANAYDQLCTSAKASISRGQFQQGMLSSPLKSFNIAGVNVSSTNGTTRATVTAQLTYADRAETRVVPMRDDGSGWKVCGNPY